MPFHFCHEELLAILAAVPMIKMIVPYLRSKWHSITGKCEHESDITTGKDVPKDDDEVEKA